MVIDYRLVNNRQLRNNVVFYGSIIRKKAKMARLLFVVPLLVLIFWPVYYIFLRAPPPLPNLDLEEWWGPESKKENLDTSVRPFEIRFGEATIKDLKDRLRRARQQAPPLEGIAFEYGFNSAQLDSWLKYWAEEYPFKEREEFFNKYPQFITNVQGLDIHFIRVTPKVPKGKEIVPMLLLHGWPGSVREFYEVIPLITAVSKDRDFAIEAIVPSLPGYGFSEAAVRPGLGAAQMAVVFRNLMHRLGYQQYYVQGGDWGAMIGTNIATLFPKEVLGFHTNMVFSMAPAATILELIGSIYPPLVVDSHLADRIYPLKNRFTYLLEETGYMHLQATKPDTVGVALSDSPSGLLAYILEKFSTWTRPEHRQKTDGGLTFRYTKEQLIDNLMMYWSPRAITTSMRLYAETFNAAQFGLKLEEIPTPVPTWVIQAKYELAYQPPSIFKRKFPNLVNVTVLQDGGHFLAFELPEAFSKDVLQAVIGFRKIVAKDAKTEL